MKDNHSNHSFRYFCRKAALVLALFVLMFTQAAFLPQTGMVYGGSGTELTQIKPIGDLNAVPPSIKAKGAAMYSIELDAFVYTKNVNKKISPYSITKILTSYLALENLDPDQKVKVSSKATRAYENGTTIFLKTGEKITVRDLLYGTMLESGNDAAYALGEAVSGSEKAFAKLMNKTVKAWGCKNTHFVNANGWKNDKHYTTARDMAIITKNCFANETLAAISMTKEYTAPATNMSGEREMKNYFLKTVGDDEGSEFVTGGKTGTWDEDDCSIALAFSKENLSEVIVLLGDTKKGRKSDSYKLIEFSQAVTPGFLVSDKGDPVQTAKVKHGEITRTTLAVDGRTVAYPSTGRADDIKIEIKPLALEAPLTKGEKAGTYTVYANGQVVGQHSLIVTEDIATGWFPSYFYISNEQTKKGLIVIAAVVLIIVILAVLSRSIRKRRKGYEGRH